MSTALFTLYDKINLIPDISDELLGRMLEQMQPVIKQCEDGGFYLIDLSKIHPRYMSYLWSPVVAGPAPDIWATYGDLNATDIVTFHTLNVFFKPSLAEVCASINRFIPNWQELNIKYWYLHADKVECTGAFRYCRCTVWAVPPEKSRS